MKPMKRGKKIFEKNETRCNLLMINLYKKKSWKIFDLQIFWARIYMLRINEEKVNCFVYKPTITTIVENDVLDR